jgi:hypothetical protein
MIIKDLKQIYTIEEVLGLWDYYESLTVGDFIYPFLPVCRNSCLDKLQVWYSGLAKTPQKGTLFINKGIVKCVSQPLARILDGTTPLDVLPLHINDVNEFFSGVSIWRLKIGK